MMTTRRIVITGIGIVSNIGIGKDDYFNALMHGMSGINEITLFDTSSLDNSIAGEIKNFDPKDFLGKKGLRLLDRTTKLVLSASKIALDDAKIEVTDDNTYDTGLVLGTTLGYSESFYNFEKDALSEGPHYVNPALFPHAIYNAPASHISIRFSIKGLNCTISTGYTASLDALGYAMHFIKLSRLNRILVGGVESLSLPVFMGFSQSGLMVNDKSLCCPFDKRRSGLIYGEGAAMFVIEDLESALQRDAAIYGEITGFGSAVDLISRTCHYDSQCTALKRSMTEALTQSGHKPDTIDYICAHANSTKDADKAEAGAIKSVFGPYSQTVPVTSIKSMIGETYSAGGALSLGAALGAIDKGFIPPIINFKEKDPECSLNCVTNQSQNKNIATVMVNAISPGGNSVSMIVSQFNK